MRARWVGLIAAGAVVVGATGGHLLMPSDTAALTPVKAAIADPTPATDPYAPSKAWLHAGPEQQVEAYSSMVGQVNDSCMRDVQHSYLGLFLTPKGEHPDLPSKQHPGQDHHFGAFTKGACDGPGADGGWPKVDPLFAEALAQDAYETGVKGHDEAYFQTCLYRSGDTAWVVCPDGFVVGS